MMQSTPVRHAYLDELARIDDHLCETRGSRAEPSASDPEVRRILEAAAFLAAQNQRIAYQATFDALHGLVMQRLDFVVRPLPARALLAAAHAGPRSALPLRQGTLVHLTTRDARTARLTTEVSAIVAPIYVRKTEWVESARGPVLLFEIELEQGLRELGWLSLHIDVLGDLARSFSLYRVLARRSRGAFLFQKEAMGARRPTPDLDFETARKLELRCGARASVEADVDPEHFDVDRVLSPLEEVRAALQFPERNLFVNLRLATERNGMLPERASAGGVIRLGILCERGVDASPVSPSCFRPNVLPVQNLVTVPAQPIKDEGYVARHVLRPPDELLWHTATTAGGSFELREVGAVVLLGGREETQLLPTSLGVAERSYRITRSVSGGDQRYHLELGVPGTAKTPRQLRVEASWFQPGLDLVSLGQVKARLFHIATEGILWRLLPAAVPCVASPVEGSADRLVELLALSNRKRLDADETLRVMRLLAQGSEAVWGRSLDAMGAMQFDEVVVGDRAALRRRVLVEQRPLPEDQLPLFDELLCHVQQVLSVWGNEAVEVVAFTRDRLLRPAGGAA